MTATVVLFDGRNTLLEPRRVVSLEAARRRSRFVRGLRLMLLMAMAGIAGTVGFLVVSNALRPAVAIEPASPDGIVRMVNPRFTGRDSGGKPYVISAQTAERPEPAAVATELAFPRLEFSGEESPAALVVADRGVYDEAARTLDLYNGVRFRTDNGYAFETEHARVYIDDGRVVGERLISGEGPLGSLRAQSFEISDGGDKVAFRENVVARLYPERRNPELRSDDDEDSGAVSDGTGDAEIPVDGEGAPADDESVADSGAADVNSPNESSLDPPAPEDAETP